MSAAPRAESLHLIGCESCGLVLSEPGQTMAHRGDHQLDHPGHCPRCAATLHRRRPDALRRCWAFLIGAVILYLPANLLPVLHTTQGLDTQDDTILSGVIFLWRDGSWDLAAIVFTASIVVPLLKIATLMLLLLSTHYRPDWRRPERARLYRVLEFIGHWSMLDVFAIALLVALVHFGKFARAEPGAGIVAFGAVVVLTMLATMSFDPRLIWDSPRSATSDE